MNGEKCKWFFILKLKDREGASIDAKINGTVPFNFSLAYLLVVDRTDRSLRNIFINIQTSGRKIKLDFKFSPFGVELYVFGLKTNPDLSIGKFETVTCHGHAVISEITETSLVDVHMESSEEIEIPLQTGTLSTLPVSVFRQPPSVYTIKVNQTFTKAKSFIVFVQMKNQLRLFIVKGNTLSMQFPFDIPSATNVIYKVLCTEEACPNVFKTATHSESFYFKTFLSLMDTYRLYNLALAFCGRKIQPNLKEIKCFYRNKFLEYFNIIFQYLDGEMRPYLKSNGGEQGSVINGRLPGLFFSTYITPETNQPNPSSFYGPIRFYMTASIMFHSMCKLYFADFYCHYRRHHVTLVLTPRFSDCDSFCQQYLLELDIYNNPFLYLSVSNEGRIHVVANMDVTVEVFYTEKINLTTALKMNLGYIEQTGILGRGFAPATGIPKNPMCTVCNLN